MNWILLAVGMFVFFMVASSVVYYFFFYDVDETVTPPNNAPNETPIPNKTPNETQTSTITANDTPSQPLITALNEPPITTPIETKPSTATPSQIPVETPSKPLLKTAQFVRLQRTDNRDEYINILEMEVYDGSNNKITAGVIPSLGPQYENANVFGPQFMIDSKATVNWGENGSGLPHTMNTKDAFMQIDLGSNKEITKVVVKNRLDCCKARIIGASLILISSDGTEIFKESINEVKDVYTFDIK